MAAYSTDYNMKINSVCKVFFVFISGEKYTEIKAIFAFNKCLCCHMILCLTEPGRHIRTVIKKVKAA